jgi:hypothetical protein
MLRRIFGPKRNSVPGEWRKLHNEELHSLPTTVLLERTNKRLREGQACSMH